jgi:hypothetical protein
MGMRESHKYAPLYTSNLLSGEHHPPLLAELRSAIVLSIMIAQALNHSWSELLTLAGCGFRDIYAV